MVEENRGENSVGIGIILIDINFKFIWLNREIEKLFGISSKQMLGKDIRAFIEQEINRIFDKPENLAGRMLAAMDGHCAERIECHMAPGEGQKSRWLEYRIQPIGAGLCAGGYIALFEDISEKKEVKEEDRRRAAYYGAINAVIAVTSQALDIANLLEIALDRILHAIGLERGAIWIAGLTVGHRLTEDTRIALGKLAEEEKTFFQEQRAISDFGETTTREEWPQIIPVMESAGIRALLVAPILAEGRIIGGLGVADSDPRLWSADELILAEVIGRQLGGTIERLGLLETTQTQANQLQLILDTVQEGIITLDANHRILIANPAARQYLTQLSDCRVGQVLEQLGDRQLSELLHLRSDGLPHEVCLKGSNPRSFEIYPNPVREGQKEIGWTLLIRDVTDVREVQRRMHEQERRAAVGQLAAGIAHDFNNIMAAIILYTEMVMREPGLSPKAHDRLTTILQQADRAATLTGQILDFSRSTVMQSRPMDLVPFMKELKKLLARTLPENIHLHLNYKDADYVVNTDPARMQQVLMNLAFNSRSAMPNGGDLTFELARIGIQPGQKAAISGIGPGDWIRIIVSDTGEGIPPEVMPHIFEPFFTTKPPGEGAGLGLAQVDGIIKQHHGFIAATSIVDKGTTFTIYIPALTMAAVPGVIQQYSGAASGNLETILVVEDDATARQAICELLEILSYRVLSASSGREALEIYTEKEERIDLILSDMVMPDLSGLELYEILKKKDSGVKMIVMTGYPLEEGGKELLESGIVAWVQKPLSSDALAHILRRVIEQSREE